MPKFVFCDRLEAFKRDSCGACWLSRPTQNNKNTKPSTRYFDPFPLNPSSQSLLQPNNNHVSHYDQPPRPSRHCLPRTGRHSPHPARQQHPLSLGCSRTGRRICQELPYVSFPSTALIKHISFHLINNPWANTQRPTAVTHNVGEKGDLIGRLTGLCSDDENFDDLHITWIDLNECLGNNNGKLAWQEKYVPQPSRRFSLCITRPGC